MVRESKHGLRGAIRASVSSNIEVRVGHVDEILVRVEGDEDGVGAVKVTDTADELRVEEDQADGDVNVVNVDGDAISVGRGGSISVSGGSVSIVGSRGSRVGRVIVNGRDVTDLVNNGADGKPRTPTTILVVVPAGKAPSLRLDVRGNCQAKLGDLRSAVRVSASGASVVEAGALGKTRVRASGTARVDVASATGDLDAKASGCASVTVSGGDLTGLDAEASGTASLLVETTVDAAELSASGCARIVVDRVRGSCSRDRSGMAKIEVRRG